MLDHERATRRFLGFLARRVLASESVAISHQAVRRLDITFLHPFKAAHRRSCKQLAGRRLRWRLSPHLGVASGGTDRGEGRGVPSPSDCAEVGAGQGVGRRCLGKGGRVGVGFQGLRERRTVSDGLPNNAVQRTVTARLLPASRPVGSCAVPSADGERWVGNEDSIG
jgi:hypothetical protein